MFYVARNHEGNCVAIVPLILTRRRVGMLKIVSLGLLGADPALTEIRTPLVQPGYADPVAHALSHSLPKYSDTGGSTGCPCHPAMCWIFRRPGTHFVPA